MRGALHRLRPRAIGPRRHAAGRRARTAMRTRSPRPGEADLTAQVDFAAVCRRDAQARPRLRWSGAAGGVPRPARHRRSAPSRLMGANPAKAGDIETAVARLMAPSGHGEPLQGDRRPQPRLGAAARARPSGQRRSHSLSAQACAMQRPSSRSKSSSLKPPRHPAWVLHARRRRLAGASMRRSTAARDQRTRRRNVAENRARIARHLGCDADRRRDALSGAQRDRARRRRAGRGERPAQSRRRRHVARPDSRSAC